ncbi:hypothetical protein GCM10010156_62310 [Planobispora rosea]|uniref:S-adenosyl methyltransferase n=1 Tax=Planobispora rosea TaxID=35762 RepID=A0A8J3S9H1_PLARO|nr:SAM-dependent methyltransferase [Planobispora rosea]GGS95603.1 hypothetical protein GCM10010156_62310 [Planobispora rosea]GIH87504.1 hypothetical protein Pro02_59120 [Planobispora rosea]
MTDQPRPPAGIDVSIPSTARIYDYMLGGKDNFAADREAAELVRAALPEAPVMARENRAFLGRAVRFLAEAGIRQFLDLGAGLPTQENVHQVAQRVDPKARVVYVDHDPIVLIHGRALLATDGTTAIVQGDMREPQAILEDPRLLELIDFGEPVAVLFVSVLHFITDAEDPHGIVASFRDRMAPGSYLVISHGSGGVRPEDEEKAQAVYDRATSQAANRSPEEIRRLFDGFDLVEPGLVPVASWRPDREPEDRWDGPRLDILAGVGRKS